LQWPSRETEHVAVEVKKAVAPQATYAEANFPALLGEATGTALDHARRAADPASTSLDALSRALLEPRDKNRAPLEAAMVVEAALR
jgi:hypothetical protein